MIQLEMLLHVAFLERTRLLSEDREAGTEEKEGTREGAW